MAEIPFWIHDRPKWVSGISKQTTCQDILLALVKAEKKNKTKDEADDDVASKEISRQLALVEQWRGVERPLANSSRILKLWQAWGEERKEVKFVVKRISTSRVSEAATTAQTASTTTAGTTTTTTSRSRKPRRRTSRASSIASQNFSTTTDGLNFQDLGYKKTDTVHPNALKKRSGPGGSSNSKLKNHEIERLMRIILAQGETIHTQLKKLQERENQIESIEQKVHDTRTRTAGKDYLLNAYLKYLPEGQGDVSCSSDRSSFGDALESIPDRLQEMLEALTKVYNLNEEIQRTEEKIGDLRCQLDVSDQALSGDHIESTRSELNELRGLNDAAGKEIDNNRKKIESMREAVDARQAIVLRLERDVGSAEQEGRHLEMQLRAIEDRRQRTIDLLQKLDQQDFDFDELDDDEDEDSGPILFADSVFLRQDSSVRPQAPPQPASSLPPTALLHGSGHFLNDGHFRISNEELYSANHHVSSASNNPRMLYDQLQRRLQIKTSSADLEELQLLSSQQPGCTDVGRISATGSPGSASSSGNSSGSSGGCGSEKSVRFSDRDLILSTPELPDLPRMRPKIESVKGSGGVVLATSKASSSSAKKSISTASDPHGDTDSNSDTGLSSLHSSSDEGTYILDTLV